MSYAAAMKLLIGLKRSFLMYEYANVGADNVAQKFIGINQLELRSPFTAFIDFDSASYIILRQRQMTFATHFQ